MASGLRKSSDVPSSDVVSSAGTSPTLWTRGLATLGPAGTRGLGESGESFEVGLGLASPGRTRESQLTALVVSKSLLGTQVRFSSLYMHYSKLHRHLGDGKLPRPAPS